jgi:hypothetical protein
MSRPLVAAVVFSLLLPAVGYAQAKDAAAQKAKEQTRALELFLGFTQQVVQTQADQKAAAKKRKADQRERARKAKRERQEKDLGPFRGVCDVYLEKQAGQPNPLTDVMLEKVVRVGGRTFFQFRKRHGQLQPPQDAESWLVEPGRIVAVRSVPTRQTGVGAPPGRFGNVPP